jgi:DedD protein
MAVKTIPQTPATATPDTRDGGPWVINILSSPSKRYAEDMQASARTHGFETSITRAEVKGKEYWRLQLPGFTSMAAARQAAEPLKAELNIADVWIFKRKR